MAFIAQTAIAATVLCLAIRTLARGSNNWIIRFSIVVGVVALSAIGVTTLITGW